VARHLEEQEKGCSAPMMVRFCFGKFVPELRKGSNSRDFRRRLTFEFTNKPHNLRLLEPGTRLGLTSFDRNEAHDL